MEENTFLGTGWSFPPYFIKETNSAAMTVGEANIRENLNLLFDTKIGERIMEFDYGTNLHALIFESNTEDLAPQIVDTVSNAILNYEPRIVLEEVKVVDNDVLNGRIDISVHYRVIGTNTRHNLVYPFYLSEGTNLTTRPQPSDQ